MKISIKLLYHSNIALLLLLQNKLMNEILAFEMDNANEINDFIKPAREALGPEGPAR